MSLESDVEAAFKAAAKVNSGKFTLGERNPVDCLLPDGIERTGEERPGRYRNSVSANLSALKTDLGNPPQQGERARLEFQGDTFEVIVSPDDDLTETGGSLYSFTVTTG